MSISEFVPGMYIVVSGTELVVVSHQLVVSSVARVVCLDVVVGLVTGRIVFVGRGIVFVVVCGAGVGRGLECVVGLGFGVGLGLGFLEKTKYYKVLKKKLSLDLL